jgi:UDP-N-acetylmuramoyl-L-alanyl-D-glutamate--2,6-diaminopimelate ligase
MTKKLFEILPLEYVREIKGSTDVHVSGVEIDSRKCKDGCLFIALKGVESDGHQYIGKAVANGAVAVICAEYPAELDDGIVYILAKDGRELAGRVADSYYDHPSSALKLVGVTGTNGKTTVSTLMYQLFMSLGYKCGLISTVENRIGFDVIPATHTTPDVISLHQLIYRMKQSGCSHVFMEVSSHAADQRRIAGLNFTGAVFTNITHDHLDYHHTMDAYIKAKKSFFDHLDKESFAVINLDDKRGAVMVQNTIARKVTYALQIMADVKGKMLENNISGMHLQINGEDVFFKLIGEFNAYNILAVYAAATQLGVSGWEVLTVLSGLRGAEGRFEQVLQPDTKICGIVDYAHTPDALENVIQTILKIKSRKSQLITVVGCGGDRDKSKRPEMARIAAVFSDKVVLTSDNPRTENPEDILDDMEKGIPDQKVNQVLRISDRSNAIKTAVMMASPGDVILVAGKGHEKYQEINGEKFPFDDKKLLEQLLKIQ